MEGFTEENISPHFFVQSAYQVSFPLSFTNTILCCANHIDNSFELNIPVTFEHRKEKIPSTLCIFNY
jgi:hypothetical protein